MTDVEVAEAEARIGGLLSSRYRIASLLGRGSSSLVFDAERSSDGTRCALKVLGGEADSRVRARALREARAVARLASPHVVRIHEVVEFDAAAPVLVMERLVGRDLRAVLADGPVSVEVAASWLVEACRGLAEVHALGIVHRDLKPSNLFLCELPGGGSRLKVLDFGMVTSVPGDDDDASLTSSGALVGTPRYLAPEVLRDPGRADARADVWSLGVVLYEALTGHNPFEAATTCGLLARISADPPVPIRTHLPDASCELVRLLEGAFEKDPARRIPSVVALGTGLAALAGRSAEITGSPRLRPRRRALLVGAMASALLAAMAGTVVLSGSSGAAAVEPERDARGTPRPRPEAIPAPRPAATAAAPRPQPPRTLTSEPRPARARALPKSPPPPAPSLAPPRSVAPRGDLTLDTRK